MSRRLTVPDDKVALVLPLQLASELRSLLRLIRQGKIYRPAVDIKPAQAIAGDVLLAMLDDSEWDLVEMRDSIQQSKGDES